MYYWKVVPISEGQSLDVRPQDLFVPQADTYRGGQAKPNLR